MIYYMEPHTIVHICIVGLDHVQHMSCSSYTIHAAEPDVCRKAVGGVGSRVRVEVGDLVRCLSITKPLGTPRAQLDITY